MIIKDQQVFNLMDTNGRRKDVSNALQLYTQILDEVTNHGVITWKSFPCLTQFRFYQKALEHSADVFKQHKPYDLLMQTIDADQTFKQALENNDQFKLNKTAYLVKYASLFDNGVEDRARHYTSNLVKLGFATEQRQVTEVGYNLLNPSSVVYDELEKLLLVDPINLIYLRQLLKLKLFNPNKNDYYAPFILAIYLLLEHERIDESLFLKILQLSNFIDHKDQFLSVLHDLDALNSLINDSLHIEIEEHLATQLQERAKLDQSLFFKIFTNKKTTNTVNLYWDFYNLCYEFDRQHTQENLNNIYSFYLANKAIVDQAFGLGTNLFFTNFFSNNVNEAIKHDLFHYEGNFNKNFYVIFKKSKQLDLINEYTDTTRRVLKTTGLISFQKGYVELSNKIIVKHIFNKEQFSQRIFGKLSIDQNPLYKDYNMYEEMFNGFLYTSHSLSRICQYNEQQVSEIRSNIYQEFNTDNIKRIETLIATKKRLDFEAFIDKNYPIEKVKQLLNLFTDRKDQEIKAIVTAEASIPTIYEYVVGLAWYYFYNKKINLLHSYNLSLTADYEPLVHARGGEADLVIYDFDYVILIEATLMNAQNQKRGEWEPVLRHSVNLKAEEDYNNTNRQVTTFFIANELDYNTINIWKAVSCSASIFI